MGLNFSTRRVLLGAQGIRWLLRDEFTDTRSAGNVNGTPATPGPGTRTVVDANSKLTVGAGVLNFATGGTGAGDPSLWWGVQAREAGRLLIVSTIPASTGARLRVG